jgi:hypothetical protein
VARSLLAFGQSADAQYFDQAPLQSEGRFHPGEPQSPRGAKVTSEIAAAPQWPAAAEL